MDLADRIRTRMTELSLTQEAVANGAEMSQAMIYKLLSRKSKNTTKIIALAEALECDVEWLATGHSSKHQVNEVNGTYDVKKISASELEKQLKALPKEQQKSIALNILKELM